MSLTWFQIQNQFYTIYDSNNSFLYNTHRKVIPTGYYESIDDILDVIVSLISGFGYVKNTDLIGTYTYTFPTNMTQLIFPTISNLWQMMALGTNALILDGTSTYTTQTTPFVIQPPYFVLKCEMPSAKNLEFRDNQVQFSQTLGIVPISTTYNTPLYFQAPFRDQNSYDIEFTSILGSVFTYRIEDMYGQPFPLQAESSFAVVMDFFAEDIVPRNILALKDTMHDIFVSIHSMEETLRGVKAVTGDPDPPLNTMANALKSLSDAIVISPNTSIISGGDLKDATEGVEGSYVRDIAESMRYLRGNRGTIQALLGIHNNYTTTDALVGLWSSLGANVGSLTPHISAGASLELISVAQGLQTTTDATERAVNLASSATSIATGLASIVSFFTDRMQPTLERQATALEGIPPPIRELKQPIENMTEQVSQRLTRIVDNVFFVQQEIHNLKQPLDTLNTSVENLKEPLDTLNTSVENLKEPLDTLNASVENLQQPITDLKEPLDMLNTTVETLKDPLVQIAPPLNEIYTSTVAIGESFNAYSLSIQNYASKFYSYLTNQRPAQSADRLAKYIDEVQELLGDPTKEKIEAWLKKNKYLKKLSSSEDDAWRRLIALLEEVLRRTPNEALARWLENNVGG